MTKNRFCLNDDDGDGGGGGCWGGGWGLAATYFLVIDNSNFINSIIKKVFRAQQGVSEHKMPSRPIAVTLVINHTIFIK